MTRNIISATPETSVMEAAALLVDNRVSALPVMYEEVPIGIVSEADLLRRYELGTQRDAAAVPWWRRILSRSNEPWNYIEAHAMKLCDVMSTPVVTVNEDTPVADIAALFESHRIKRAPVLEAGRVVGIVSRSDFVRALLARPLLAPPALSTSNEAIRHALLIELQSQPWWHARRCQVSVSDGIVRYAGEYDKPEDKIAARVAAERIHGVRGVEDSRSNRVPATHSRYPAGIYL